MRWSWSRPPRLLSSSRTQLDNEIVLGVLGVLAMVGIFFLVSSVIGFIEVMPQSQSDSLARVVPRTAIRTAR